MDEHTIGHVEINTPGINLPYPLSDIPPRLSLLKSITGPIAGEPHPPGYYILMYFWTKAFGTSPFSIRFPSVLFGVGMIILTFILAVQAQDRLTGILAAAMVAINGYQIWWAQIAKMITLGGFLGLLSTILLFWMAKRTYNSRVIPILYALFTIAGLATTLFIWPIFITQMMWVWISSSKQQGSMPGLLKLQFLVFILATPLWSIAAYQSGRESYLSTSGMFTSLGQYIQFGYLFPPDSWSIPPRLISGYLFILLIVLGLFLLVLGLWKQRKHQLDGLSSNRLPPGILILASVFSFIVILGFTVMAYFREPGRTGLVLATGILPFLLAAILFLLEKYWGKLQWIALLPDYLNVSLPALLALIPVLLLVGISLIIPIYADRNAFPATPYLFIVLSTGLAALIRKNRAWLLLLLVVVVLHGYSIQHYSRMPKSPINYKGLADQWLPAIEDNDLIFVQPGWPTTPIFYYLTAEQFEFVGWDYTEAVLEHPEARIWVLTLDGWPNPKPWEAALAGFKTASSLESMGIETQLFVRE